METKIIETPFKKFKVEIKNYLTARDELEIQKIMYDAAQIKNGIIADVKGSQADVMINMEKKLMEKAVVGINDDKENIVERLLDMPSVDYDFIKTEVDKIRITTEVKKK